MSVLSRVLQALQARQGSDALAATVYTDVSGAQVVVQCGLVMYLICGTDYVYLGGVKLFGWVY